MTTESNLSEESIQNAFITMNTLIQQNRRLMMFQEMSYKWHMRHHGAMKEIIRELNVIIEFLKIDDFKPVEIHENRELLIPPPKFLDALYKPFYGNMEKEKKLSESGPPPQDDVDMEDIMKDEDDCIVTPKAAKSSDPKSLNRNKTD